MRDQPFFDVVQRHDRVLRSTVGLRGTMRSERWPFGPKQRFNFEGASPITLTLIDMFIDDTDLVSPRDITVDDDGATFWIVDTGNGDLAHFDADGLQTGGTHSDYFGGVAHNGTDLVYARTSPTEYVHISEGLVEGTVEASPTGEPSCLVYDDGGYWGIVDDSSTYTVYRFDDDFDVVDSWAAPSELDWPVGIAVYGSYLFLTDSTSTSAKIVQVAKSDPTTVIQSFTDLWQGQPIPWGGGTIDECRPTGLVFNGDKLYVCDRWWSSVWRFQVG